MTVPAKESLEKVNAVLNLLNLYDRYAAAFKEQEMTDELVQHCIEDKANALGQIIPILGQRIKFERAFTRIVQSSDSTDSQGTDDPPSEHSMSESSPLRNCLLPTASQEVQAGGENSEQLAEPWRKIAHSLNLETNSKDTVLMKVVAKAIEIYEGEIESKFLLPTDCYTESQLKEIRSCAEESALSYLEQILQGADMESLEPAKKTLDKELAKRVGPLQLRNMKHTEACVDALERTAERICETFVNVVKEQVLRRVLTRDEFDSIATAFKQASQVQFAEACEHLPKFHMEILERKIEQRREYFWFQVQQMGEEFSKIRIGLVQCALKLYQETMETGATVLTQLEEVHDSAKTRAMKFFNDPSIEPGLREAALKEFQTIATDFKNKVAEKLG